MTYFVSICQLPGVQSILKMDKFWQYFSHFMGKVIYALHNSKIWRVEKYMVYLSVLFRLNCMLKQLQNKWYQISSIKYLNLVLPYSKLDSLLI